MPDPQTELQPYRVLALDGGGIRGLYTAVLLAGIAERYARRAKKPEKRLHPQPSPSPSSTDFQKLQEIFRVSKHELRAFLMVVVGTHPFPAGLWCGLVSDNKIVHLTTG